MARDSILKKLDKELRLPLKRESQALYIVAEIRKVIEHERETSPNPYEVLELFCNWALHIKISRKSNADRIRLFFAAFDLREGMSLQEYLQSEFFNRMMRLEVLRSELEHFLANHGLPCRFVQEYRDWSAFVYLYTSIVSEVPLKYAKGDLLPEEVESLTITRMPQQATPQMMTKWAVKLQNGKEFFGATLYGQYRNDAGFLVGVPDFFDEQFQL
jgi:hypothetical protein